MIRIFVWFQEIHFVDLPSTKPQFHSTLSPNRELALKIIDPKIYAWNTTLPETNSEFTPENGWLEDEISFWDASCSGANCQFQGTLIWSHIQL